MFTKRFWVWGKCWSIWLKEGKDLTWYLTQATHFINAGDFRYKYQGCKRKTFILSWKKTTIKSRCLHNAQRLQNWKNPWSRSLVSLESFEQSTRSVKKGERRRKKRLLSIYPLRWYTHKTSGFKMSVFKTYETSGLQNVTFTKHQVYKTSGRQNVRSLNRQVFKKTHPYICCTCGWWKI